MTLPIDPWTRDYSERDHYEEYQEEEFHPFRLFLVLLASSAFVIFLSVGLWHAVMRIIGHLTK